MDVLTARRRSSEFDDGSLLKRAMELERILVSQYQDLQRECRQPLYERLQLGGVVYAHQLPVTIGPMVEDLELLAKATTQTEWLGRIEHLPLN